MVSSFGQAAKLREVREAQQELVLNIIGGIIVGISSNAVAVLAKRRWTLMKTAWIHSLQEQELLRQKGALQQLIKNPELTAQMASTHVQALHQLHNGCMEGAEHLFVEMRGPAQDESSRLGQLAQDRVALYGKEPDRMTYLTQVRDEQFLDLVQDANLVGVDDTSDKSYVESMKVHAEWCLPDLRHILVRIIDVFNKSTHPRELERLGLLPAGSGFLLPFQPSLHVLKPEGAATRMGTHCGLILGRVKDAGRALAKVETDYKPEAEAGLRLEQPTARYVCDWLRATVLSEDPYALVVLLGVFRHIFDCVRIKNNFANNTLEVSQRTNMLANFRMHVPSLGVCHVFEIQFKLQDLYAITKEMHNYYDVVRATEFRELASKPIFDAYAQSTHNEDESDECLHRLLCKFKCAVQASASPETRGSLGQVNLAARAEANEAQVIELACLSSPVGVNAGIGSGVLYAW